jgi:hypothetical protein
MLRFFLIFFYVCTTFAFDADFVISKEKEAEAQINTLYQLPQLKHKLSLVNKVNVISRAFIGQSYELGALGEGLVDEFDQYPRFRTDAFDCETYVTTVLALALATDFHSFQSQLNRFRYRERIIAFVNRFHFTELEWNQAMQSAKVLVDITKTIKDKDGHPIYKHAIAVIDRGRWLKQLAKNRIRLVNQDKKDVNVYLKRLRQRHTLLKKETSVLPYLPLSVLFKAQKPLMSLFNQIPNGVVIEIVRPNWAVHTVIGTHLNVSHLGFGFWKSGVLYFREASMTEGRVIDIPLVNYLKNMLDSPTIKGIYIQKIVDSD